MKINRADLTNMLRGIDSIDLPGVKFNYALLKNKKKIQAELKTLSNTLKPSEKYSAFDKARVELCKNYCAKNSEGAPIIKQGKFEGLIKNKEFDAALEKLKGEFKETLDAETQKMKDYQELLLKEVDMNLHKIPFRDVPEKITTKQLEAIMPIVAGVDNKKDE